MQLGAYSLNFVRIAGWDEYGWMRHGFSTRAGGVSSVYGEHTLNLGWTKEDDDGAVAENRRRFLAVIMRLGTQFDAEKRDAVPQNAIEMLEKRSLAQQGTLVTLRQVHSAVSRVVEAGDGALEGRLQTAEGRAVLEGDGMMTDVPGVMLGIQVADCVPVIVADVKRRAVGVFHAGWRGTEARIVEQGIGTMRMRYGSSPEDLVAAVGPSIGVCCYSVGEELRLDFESQFAYSKELFSRRGSKVHLDLWEANRRQLLDAGVPEERISVVGECTACAMAGAGRSTSRIAGRAGLRGG